MWWRYLATMLEKVQVHTNEEGGVNLQERRRRVMERRWKKEKGVRLCDRDRGFRVRVKMYDMRILGSKFEF